MKTEPITDCTNDLFITKAHKVSLANLHKIAKTAKISIVQCNFDCTHYKHKLFEKASINFPNELLHAVKKRQSEFLAGRMAAQLALSELSIDNIDIPIGKNRAPVWPNGIMGSITHTSNTAICAVTFDSGLSNGLKNGLDSDSDCGYSILGLDLENQINGNTVEEIKYNVINKKEEQLLKEKALNFPTAFTLTFSAKESLFKALHPSVGFYFDFTDAEIIDLSIENNSFDLVLNRTLTSKHLKGTIFKGIFHIEANKILTLIAQ